MQHPWPFPTRTPEPTDEREQYEALLKAHDWFYEYSDDHRVWQAGVTERRRIQSMKQRVDPDGSIYAKYKPQTL